MRNASSRILTLALLAIPLALVAWVGSAAMAETDREEAYEDFRGRVVRDDAESEEGKKDRDRKRDGDREGEGKARKRDRGDSAEGKARKRGDGDKGESEEGGLIKALNDAKVDLAGAITKAEQASGGKAIAARYVRHHGRLFVLVQLVTKRGRTNAAVNAETGKVRLQKGHKRDKEGEGGRKRQRDGDKEGEGRKRERDGDRGGKGRKRERGGDKEGED
jgi:hypothetical protein